jgi:hypothetical protein
VVVLKLTLLVETVGPVVVAVPQIQRIDQVVRALPVKGTMAGVASQISVVEVVVRLLLEMTGWSPIRGAKVVMALPMRSPAAV